MTACVPPSACLNSAVVNMRLFRVAHAELATQCISGQSGVLNGPVRVPQKFHFTCVGNREVSMGRLPPASSLQGTFTISVLPMLGPRKLSRRLAAQRIYLVSALGEREEKVCHHYLNSSVHFIWTPSISAQSPK